MEGIFLYFSGTWMDDTTRTWMVLAAMALSIGSILYYGIYRPERRQAERWARLEAAEIARRNSPQQRALDLAIQETLLRVYDRALGR
jgi:hypothetical protein